MICSEILERYKAMLDLSRQMHESALKSEWDRLIELGNARTAIVDELREQDTMSWSGPESAQKEKLIRAVMASDAQTQALTQSWIAKLQETLDSIVAKKKLRKAYESR